MGKTLLQAVTLGKWGEKMNILGNDLIWKYFGCPHRRGYCTSDCLFSTDARILQAMQEPIKKGERFLAINGGDITESVCGHNLNESLHTNCLRLPDKFQKRECECWVCPGHDHKDCSLAKACHCQICHQPQRDEVEEKIQHFKHRAEHYWKDEQRRMGITEDELRELVRLARKGLDK